jgi:hypothetical protein
MGFAYDMLHDSISRLVWAVASLKPLDQFLLGVTLFMVALCIGAIGDYARGRNRRLAIRELHALRDDFRASNTIVTMDVAIGICKRLSDIEVKYGEKCVVGALVVDSHGVPARLTLTAN